MSYSAQNSARTLLILILLEFCSISEKIFRPLGRIYFHKYRREPGPSPKNKLDIHNA